MAGDRVDLSVLASEARARVPLADVVEGYGVRLVRRGRSLVGLCPFHDDRRPSLDVDPGRGLWLCRSCGASGDAVTWIERSDGLDAKGAILALAERAGIDPASFAELGPPPPRAPARRATTPPPWKPPARNPDRVAEVRDLWARCLPVSVHDEARRYLLARGLDPARVAALDLARGLPLRGDLPVWARLGRHDWREDGRLVVVPMHDRAGELVALRARWSRSAWSEDAQAWRVAPCPGDTKEAAARGSDTRDGPTLATTAGTYALCPVARWLLSEGPGAAPGGGPEGAPWSGRVWLVEGPPDLWAVACALARSLPHGAARPALIAYVSGSGFDALAGRIPRASRVTVWPHNDDSGRRMAEDARATLPHTVTRVPAATLAASLGVHLGE